MAPGAIKPRLRGVAAARVRAMARKQAMRGTAKGTVRAQSAAIYSKAGVDGRGRFVSLFLEELLADDGPRPATGATRG